MVAEFGTLAAGSLKGIKALRAAAEERKIAAAAEAAEALKLAKAKKAAEANKTIGFDGDKVDDGVHVSRGGGILVVPNSSVPHGFANMDELAEFGSDMRTGLARAGYENAEPLLQGSAVTGKSFKTGQPFDVGRISDFDVALADPSLLDKAQEMGIGLRSGGTRTGPLSARDLRVLGLRELSTQMGQQAGREVNFMIYIDSATAAQRAPSVILPGRK